MCENAMESIRNIYIFNNLELSYQLICLFLRNRNSYLVFSKYIGLEEPRLVQLLYPYRSKYR